MIPEMLGDKNSVFKNESIADLRLRNAELNSKSEFRIPNSAIIRGLYAIVDDSFADPAGLARKILAGGCRLVQLRAKNASTAGLLKTAREMKRECDRYGATFIVNDRVDIAAAVGANGVHIGQDDLPLKEARKILGNEKIVGVSTHDLGEALRAESGGADYVGFGPIFSTDTKEDAQDPKCVYLLERIGKRISVPVVAIGGIKRKNIGEVFEAGADAAALISEICGAEDVTRTTSLLVGMVEGYDDKR